MRAKMKVDYDTNLKAGQELTAPRFSDKDRSRFVRAGLAEEIKPAPRRKSAEAPARATVAKPTATKPKAAPAKKPTKSKAAPAKKAASPPAE